MMTAPNQLRTLSVHQATKKIVPLALTMAGTQLINVSSGFLCIMMLAHLGHTVLAASSLMISTSISVMVTGMSVLFSLSFLIGHAFGAKKFTVIGNYIQQGWTLALIISILTMLIFWFIAPILRIFGQSSTLIPYVQSYFHAYIWAVLPFQWAVCNQQFCYGTHQQRLAIMTSCLSVVVLLIVAYVLIFGKFGLPALGVAGLGYAQAVQGWFGLILLTLLIYHREDFKKFDLFTYRAYKNWHDLQQIFKIGWPMCVQMSSEMVSFFIAALMVGWVGMQSLAAYQVVNQYLFLTVVPIFALSQAVGIVVGQARGAERFDEIRNIGYAGLQISLVWAIIASLAFVFFPGLLASLYLNSADPTSAATLVIVKGLFLIVAVSQIFDAARNVITGALRGLFDSRFPMFISVVGLWVISLPLAYTLAFICGWGVYGIAAGSALGMLIGATMVLMRWNVKTKKVT